MNGPICATESLISLEIQMTRLEWSNAQVETRVEARVETRVETRVEPKPKTPELVLALLSAEPDLTLKEVALRLDKATSTIERAASGLVKAGRLRFVGPRKRGRWELL